jgi:hypothetical protein
MDEIPRRCQMEHWTPAERAIYDAMQAVEAMPADTRLTSAVIKLGDAQNLVADFVDGVQQAQPAPTPSGPAADSPNAVERLVKAVESIHCEDISEVSCYTVNDDTAVSHGPDCPREALREALRRLREADSALKALVIDARRLCDRNLGGTYEEDCRRSIARAEAAARSRGGA